MEIVTKWNVAASLPLVTGHCFKTNSEDRWPEWPDSASFGSTQKTKAWNGRKPTTGTAAQRFLGMFWAWLLQVKTCREVKRVRPMWRWDRLAVHVFICRRRRTPGCVKRQQQMVQVEEGVRLRPIKRECKDNVKMQRCNDVLCNEKQL